MSWDINFEDGVVVVTMNTNAENRQNDLFFNDLHDTLDKLEKDYPYCPIILTAKGPIFSVGLDFESVFSFLASANEEDAYQWFKTYKSTNLRLFSHPAPTIAAINGHAVAGGTITAIVCDYRIVAKNEKLKMGLTETQVGLPIPYAYTELFSHILGTQQASLSGMFGLSYNIYQAKDMGYLHQIVEPDQLIHEALKMARSIPKNSLKSYVMTKKSLQYSVLERIKNNSDVLDREAVKEMISPESLTEQANTYKAIKGTEPPWKICA